MHAVPWLLLFVNSISVYSYSDLRPHHYPMSVLKPFSGRPLPYTLSGAEAKKLFKGKSVILRDSVSATPPSATGDQAKRWTRRAKIIQDIEAPPSICLENVLNFRKYPKMVSLVKKLDIYDRISHKNGTEVTYAKFEVGLLYLSIGYYLKLMYTPDFNTLTWTLDYTRDSDFGRNWSRVLYSTEVILPDWLPSFAINFVERAALTESTAWLKRESEKIYREQIKASPLSRSPPPRAFVEAAHVYREDSKSGEVNYIPDLLCRSDEEFDSGGAMQNQRICKSQINSEASASPLLISSESLALLHPGSPLAHRTRRISKVRIRRINV